MVVISFWLFGISLSGDQTRLRDASRPHSELPAAHADEGAECLKYSTEALTQSRGSQSSVPSSYWRCWPGCYQRSVFHPMQPRPGMHASSRFNSATSITSATTASIAGTVTLQ